MAREEVPQSGLESHLALLVQDSMNVSSVCGRGTRAVPVMM